MSSLVAVLVGILFVVIGGWILALRFVGFVDWVSPHNMAIGQMTVDGTENKGIAELLRARFDYHFRRPVAIARETGFLEMASLNAPDLFQQEKLSAELQKMTVEISGVDVGRVVQFVKQFAEPSRWVIEGDFQTQSDRVLLALRFSRGDRLIRTWYLERVGNPATDKPALIEGLIDDAIFQLVYDFGSNAEQNIEMRKWRNVIAEPEKYSFPSPAATAAYYEGRAALERYYTEGGWKDLDLAIGRLQDLRGLMPQFADGLQLLAMALAEKRNDREAIHVYEQLRLVLLPTGSDWKALSADARRRIFSIDLLKATATAKLDTWQSTHDAVAQLLSLADRLRLELKGGEDHAYRELLAHTEVQLAYAYALYLVHLRDYTVAQVFGDPSAPASLKVGQPDLGTLQDPRPDAAAASKEIVRRVVRRIADEYHHSLESAEEEQHRLEPEWSSLKDGPRRRRELDARLRMVAGFASYRMAEWEASNEKPGESLFGEPLDARLDEAADQLSKADAEHPNHYQVLQLLGMVYSEPRRVKEPSIAEQYFERAIRANPFDHYGHELLADILRRRIATRGVDLASRPTIERGISEAQKAIEERETSGEGHLLRAELLTMLLEIERDPAKRREYRAALSDDIDQAARFLPKAFQKQDPDLTWVQAVDAARRLGEDDGRAAAGRPHGFDAKKRDLETTLDNLLAHCANLERRWVNQQRVYHIQDLEQKATLLKGQVEHATPNNWRDIIVRFW